MIPGTQPKAKAPAIAESVLAQPEQISFCRYVADALWPKWKYARLFLALVIIKGCSYWVISKVKYPQEPASVIAMYRVDKVADHGDTGYLPMMQALSRLNIGERAVMEQEGRGIASFSFASMIPLAVAFRLFGVAGLAVVDIFCALGYYLALVALMRVVQIRENVAYCASVLIVCGLWHLLPDLVQWAPLTFWDFRMPRPLVTDVFFMICVGLIFALLSSGRESRAGWWFTLGIAYAALVQGEIYQAVSVAGIIFILAAYLFKRDFGVPGQAMRHAGGLLAMIAGGAIAGWPFLVQRLHENHDATRRLGMFKLPNHPLWLLPKPEGYVMAGTVLVLALISLALLRRVDLPAEAEAARKRNVRMLFVFSVASLLAMPVFVLVLGQGIQLFHFELGAEEICSLALLILAVFIFEDFTRLDAGAIGRRRFGEAPRGWATAGVAAILVVCLGCTMRNAVHRAARRTFIQGGDYPEYLRVPDYRTSFVELTRELSSPKYRGSVIGTFDGQVYCWWLTFMGGYSEMPDPFCSTLPDAEIERRMMYLSRLVGMNAEQFCDFAGQTYPEVLWLAHQKYQVSREFTFGPLEEYTPEVREKIAEKTDITGMGELVIAIPSSERKRLISEFANGPGEAVPRLDFIVLSKGPLLAQFSPPAGKYEKTYENAVFRVFRRIPSA